MSLVKECLEQAQIDAVLVVIHLRLKPAKLLSTLLFDGNLLTVGAFMLWWALSPLRAPCSPMFSLCKRVISAEWSAWATVCLAYMCAILAAELCTATLAWFSTACLIVSVGGWGGAPALALWLCGCENLLPASSSLATAFDDESSWIDL